jgi:hypothetical protein
MTIQYNTPIEVNQKQYNICMSRHHGICAGRKDKNGKYFIKVLLMKYAKEVEKDLLNNQ